MLENKGSGFRRASLERTNSGFGLLAADADAALQVRGAGRDGARQVLGPPGILYVMYYM